MVRTWAEKEFGNLMKIHRAGLPVPKPYVFKPPVIIMDFLGHNGQAAKRLKVRLYHIIINCFLSQILLKMALIRDNFQLIIQNNIFI